MKDLRAILFRHLAAEHWRRHGLSPLNRFILFIVMVSIVLGVLQSEPSLRQEYEGAFAVLNIVLAILFSLEYAARVWTAGENSRYAGLGGRIRYILTPSSLVDLLATLSLWSAALLGSLVVYGVLLRLVRVFRIIILARHSEWAVAMTVMGEAIAERKHELTISIMFALVVILVSATILFVVEGAAQPDQFGSIPRAIWWAMATLTTIGYGDAVPITVLGKVCAALIGLMSIAIIAMPTGIMAAALSDVFQKLREYRTHLELEEAEELKEKYEKQAERAEAAEAAKGMKPKPKHRRQR